MKGWKYSNSGALYIDLDNMNTTQFQPLKGMTGWMVKINGKLRRRGGSSVHPDGEGCLSGWVTLWSLVSKQIRVKTSTGGEQFDQVCGINMLLKPVFARLCPSVPPAPPNNDWYNLLFPSQRCTPCYCWLTAGLAESVVGVCACVWLAGTPACSASGWFACRLASAAVREHFFKLDYHTTKWNDNYIKFPSFSFLSINSFSKS